MRCTADLSKTDGEPQSIAADGCDKRLPMVAHNAGISLLIP